MTGAAPRLDRATVHVWRVRLDDLRGLSELRGLLSDDERARADRFLHEEHRTRFVVAHGWKRRILAQYVERPPEALRFAVGTHGKPALVAPRDDTVSAVEFNLSHSGEIALVAVAAGAPVGTPVGVDVERWDAKVEHLALAERFFSPNERMELRRIADRSSPGERAARVAVGFFAAWSRKEAYLKATGAGITRRLHHFDVTLDPELPAALLADRLDDQATARWRLHALEVAAGYSGALVTGRAVTSVEWYDAVSLDF